MPARTVWGSSIDKSALGCNAIVDLRRSYQDIDVQRKWALSVCFQPTCGYNRLDADPLQLYFYGTLCCVLVTHSQAF